MKHLKDPNAPAPEGDQIDQIDQADQADLPELGKHRVEWSGGSPDTPPESNGGAEILDFPNDDQVVPRRTKKRLFYLAFIGLLFDFFVGVGWLLCLPVALYASRGLSKEYAAGKRLSSKLLWATVVGYLGAILGFVFFALML